MESRKLVFAAVFALVMAAVLLGSAMNSEGVKYSSVRREAATQRLARFSEHSLAYDPRLRLSGSAASKRESGTDWVCTAAYDPVNALFAKSLLRSLLLPLLPVLLSIAADALSLYLQNKNNDSNDSINGSNGGHDSDKDCVRARHRQTATKRLVAGTRRLRLYLGIALTRIIVLYQLPLQLLHFPPTQSLENCWFRGLVADKKCLMQFDFSDHIVFAVVQCILPSLLEAMHTLSRSPLQRSPLHWLALFAAGTIILLQLRTLFLTALFFHTPAENLVGLAVALLAVLAMAALAAKAIERRSGDDSARRPTLWRERLWHAVEVCTQ